MRSYSARNHAAYGGDVASRAGDELVRSSSLSWAPVVECLSVLGADLRHWSVHHRERRHDTGSDSIHWRAHR